MIVRPSAFRAIRSQFGVTLIEVLVAVTLLAIFGVLAYRGLSGIRDSHDHLVKRGERWQSIVHAVDRMVFDLHGQAEQSLSLPGGASIPPLQLNAQAQNEQPLLTVLRASHAVGHQQRLAYRCREQRIELLLWPTIEATQSTVPSVFTLLEGVRALEFNGLDQQLRWQGNWPLGGDEALPRAIRFRITLQEGGVIERTIFLP